MFTSMRIRTKLAIALTIPLIALAGLSWVAVGAYASEAQNASMKAAQTADQVELATSTLGPGGVITTLQNERNIVSLDLIGMSGLTSAASAVPVSPTDARRLDDEAIARFKDEISRRSDSVRQAYQPAFAATDQLAGVRAKVDAYTGKREISQFSVDIFDAYSKVITGVFDANATVALSVYDPRLRDGAEIIDLSARITEYDTQIVRTAVFGALAGQNGIITDSKTIGDISALGAKVDQLQGELTLHGVGPYEPLVKTFTTDANIVRFHEEIDEALGGLPVAVADMIRVDNLVATQALQKGVESQLTADGIAVRQKASDDASSAEGREHVVIAIAIGVFMLAVALAAVASRSISRPLRRLASDAEEMAEQRLPASVQGILEIPLGEDVDLPELQEVDASGGYEVAEVAGALNTVQSRAMELAFEQAVLRRNIADSFVNLGRRNQNLLSRQLDAITDMERDEHDPGELHKLFALDHLATRMRRNAESLLLLAGLEPHRQWSDPVPVADILRGALGEVEDYDRVRVRQVDVATVKGTAAADVTHMVAELLENALNYSPPGRDVEVIGRVTADGYTLAIIDSGVGMQPDDLAQANIRVAGNESFTVAPSRYLGHYVVGAQAARLGVSVLLLETPTGGVTARIDLTAVLNDDETSSWAASDERAPAADEPATDQVTPVDEQLDPFEVDEGSDPAAAPTTLTSPAVPAAAARADGYDVVDDLLEGLLDEGDRSGPSEAKDRIPAEDGGVTSSGYKRRVRGANTPRTEVRSARGKQPEPPNSPLDVTAADDLRSLLSGLQAGTEKGRADARSDREKRNEGEQR